MGFFELICGSEFSAAGFIWRYGKDARIDIKPLLEVIELRKKRNKETFGKKVTQYSMKGKWLAQYLTIIDASNATGIARSEISKVMNQKGNRYSAGGFYWQKGYGPAMLDL